MTGHWTERSTDDFVYRISSDFALQIENKLDAEKMKQSQFADRLHVTDGRVSQVLRNPGNFTLRKMVEYARALGMKVSVIAYNDDDPHNQNGPVNSEIFTLCWTRAGRPTDFYSLQESALVGQTSVIQYVERPEKSFSFQTDWTSNPFHIVLKDSKWNTSTGLFAGGR